MVSLWIIFLSLIKVYYTHSYDSGWLAMMEAGTQVELEQLWNDPNYSYTTDKTNHRKSRHELMSNGALYYRSPLVDEMNSIRVHELDIVLFNSELGYMDLFPFTLQTPGNASDITDYYLISSYEDCVFGNTSETYSSIYIYEKGYFEMFSFMAIYMEAGLAGLTGEQFIVSVNNTFGRLNDTLHIGCYQIYNPAVYVNVTTVFNCTKYCLTVPDCRMIGLYHITGQNDVRCVALKSAMDVIPLPDVSFCERECLDDKSCGGEVLQTSTLAIASIYELDTTFQTKLLTMKEENTHYETKEYIINYNSMVGILGDPIFINGLRVEGQGVFMVATWDERCAIVVKENEHVYNGSDFYYMKDSSGTLKSFEAGFTYEFAPLKLQCMYFNTTSNFTDQLVKLQVVTNEFQLATYIGIYGSWEGCIEDEIMDQTNLISKDDIDLITERLPANLTTGQFIITPHEYKLVIHLHMLNGNNMDAWIKSLKIGTSVYADILIKVSTSKNCSINSTDQLNQKNINMNISASISDASYTYNEYFTSLLGNNNANYFCAENIDVEIVSTNVNSISEYLFQSKLEVRGCVITKASASTCAEVNLIDTGNVNVTMRRILRRGSYNTLRPGGDGLPIVDFQHGTYLVINFQNIIEVKQVIIIGGIESAIVKLDSIISYDIDRQNETLMYTFYYQMGEILTISNITLPSTYTFSWPVITVAIYACEANVLMETSTTLTSTTSESTTSTVTSESTAISTAATSTATLAVNLRSTTSESTSAATSSEAVSSTFSGTSTTPTYTTSFNNHMHSTLTTSTENVPSSTIQSTTENLPSSTTTNNPTSTSSIPQTTNSGGQNNAGSSDNKSVNQTCVCMDVAILTKKEIDESVAEIQKKLTVPPKETSAFKRTKISAPDERTSSAVIGAVGVTTMVFAGVLVMVMDISHIINAYNFIKALIRK